MTSGLFFCALRSPKPKNCGCLRPLTGGTSPCNVPLAPFYYESESLMTSGLFFCALRSPKPKNCGCLRPLTGAHHPVTSPLAPFFFFLGFQRRRQLSFGRTPLASLLARYAPAPPTVSCVVCDHLSPAGPIPLPLSVGGQASRRILPSAFQPAEKCRHLLYAVYYGDSSELGPHQLVTSIMEALKAITR